MLQAEDPRQSMMGAERGGEGDPVLVTRCPLFRQCVSVGTNYSHLEFHTAE